MSSMDYCMFQNTLNELAPCQTRLEEMLEGTASPLSHEELRAAKALVQVCYDIVTLVAEQREVPLDELDEKDAIDDGVDEIQESAQAGDFSEEESNT